MQSAELKTPRFVISIVRNRITPIKALDWQRAPHGKTRLVLPRPVCRRCGHRCTGPAQTALRPRSLLPRFEASSLRREKPARRSLPEFCDSSPSRVSCRYHQALLPPKIDCLSPTESHLHEVQPQPPRRLIPSPKHESLAPTKRPAKPDAGADDFLIQAD